MIEGKRQISPQSFARMGWSDHKESSQPSFSDRGGGRKVYNEAYTRNSAATPLDVLLRRSEYAQLQRSETVMPVPEPLNVNSSDPVSFCIYHPFVFSPSGLSESPKRKSDETQSTCAICTIFCTVGERRPFRYLDMDAAVIPVREERPAPLNPACRIQKDRRSGNGILSIHITRHSVDPVQGTAQRTMQEETALMVRKMPV